MIRRGCVLWQHCHANTSVEGLGDGTMVLSVVLVLGNRRPWQHDIIVSKPCPLCHCDGEKQLEDAAREDQQQYDRQGDVVRAWRRVNLWLSHLISYSRAQAE